MIDVHLNAQTKHMQDTMTDLQDFYENKFNQIRGIIQQNHNDIDDVIKNTIDKLPTALQEAYDDVQCMYQEAMKDNNLAQL